MKITKAIIAVAGYGTRRLPITKSIEKCMLPLLNRPIIDYVVQDCILAGITDIYFVVSAGAPQLMHYYSEAPELEAYLRSQSKADLIPTIRPPEGVKFHYIEQDRTSMLGTTVPVWLNREVIGSDESFVVVMGDQCLYRLDNGSDLADLIKKLQNQPKSAGMVAVKVAKELVSQYGIVALDANGNFSHIVDRPTVETAPSRLNNASVYVFPPTIWQYIEADIASPHHGEYMITDVINNFVAAGHTLAVHPATGVYLDCGTLNNWVQSNVTLLQTHLSRNS